MATAPERAQAVGTGPSAAEVELLGALAYGELSGFLRLAAEAPSAPTLMEVEGLARLAVEQFWHFRVLRTRLSELGVAPEAAMGPFTAALDAFHARTTPSDWTESLVKAYVGDGIAADFYLEISAHVGETTRRLVHEVLGAVEEPGAEHPAPGGAAPSAEQEDLGDFVVAAVGRAAASDPQLSSRLALWGRRLVGEALSQAQGIVTDHPALASLLTGRTGQLDGSARRFGAPPGNDHGADLVEVGAMFTRITQAHVRRMGRLGLTA